MKTTIELPDPLFRRIKAAAAEEGKSLKEFFTEAASAHLRRGAMRPIGRHSWEAAFGGLKDLHRESQRINRVIAEEFEKIDEEEWR